MRNAKILLAALLALGASACGFSESKFEKKAQTATCEYTVECFDSHADVGACEDDDSGEEVDTSDCEYDSDKAKECVDALEALTCDSTSFPTVCGEVYDCGGSSNNTSNNSNNTSNMTNNTTM